MNMPLISSPRLKLKSWFSDDNVKAVIDTIMDQAQTGQMGDGKIFITDLEEAIRIRTGETGKDAV